MSRIPDMIAPVMDATFFATPAEFRHWLEENHETASELWVGFHKTKTGKPSITWPESVDEALCFGWIDAVRKRIDDDSYMIRFTRRKPGSIWSLVNVRKVEELIRQKRMKPAGLKAFEARDEKKTGIYSFEGSALALDAAAEKELRAHRQAWDFYQKQAPSYRKAAEHWVMGAKKEETRAKRLAQLIEDSEKGARLAHLTSPGKKKD
jgi:uncharacterized protein YdeI (YjbR/CyaY-like superfamily)